MESLEMLEKQLKKSKWVSMIGIAQNAVFVGLFFIFSVMAIIDLFIIKNRSDTKNYIILFLAILCQIIFSTMMIENILRLIKITKQENLIIQFKNLEMLNKSMEEKQDERN